MAKYFFSLNLKNLFGGNYHIFFYKWIFNDNLFSLSQRFINLFQERDGSWWKKAFNLFAYLVF